MLKTIRHAVIGALAIVAMIGTAWAGVGTAPQPQGDEALINQQWVYGVAAGQNATYIYGVSAAGTNQTTSTQLAAGYTLVEIDTVSSSTGVALPPALQGTEISIYNNTATTVNVYPSIANNGATSAQDTINNSTSTTITGHTSLYVFCAKNGVWAAK